MAATVTPASPYHLSASVFGDYVSLLVNYVDGIPTPITFDFGDGVGPKVAQPTAIGMSRELPPGTYTGTAVLTTGERLSVTYSVVDNYPLMRLAVVVTRGGTQVSRDYLGRPRTNTAAPATLSIPVLAGDVVSYELQGVSSGGDYHSLNVPGKAVPGGDPALLDIDFAPPPPLQVDPPPDLNS